MASLKEKLALNLDNLWRQRSLQNFETQFYLSIIFLIVLFYFGTMTLRFLRSYYARESKSHPFYFQDVEPNRNI